MRKSWEILVSVEISQARRLRALLVETGHVDAQIEWFLLHHKRVAYRSHKGEYFEVESVCY